MWIRIDNKFRDEVESDFIRSAKNELASEVKTTDFAQNCVQEVNSWVEDATRGKIKQLLSEGSITRETVMILLNALHFKGKWQFPFPKDRTSDADFTAEDGTKQRVPLMTLKRRLHAYVDDGGHAAVRLPYGTGRFAMVAMLPPQGESLEGFVSSLAGDGPRGCVLFSFSLSFLCFRARGRTCLCLCGFALWRA